ncbi:uncharacterized protein B0P05DRAFT_578742 [Gilbertella persicaria]|uniref:uncharacterized protein n=1 Tax=Gilbertella persicaria TaxID=101096 RepID=UPI0022211705|nr:uncharacterized protein B0P05DRAFT_578742 [Gilbertella persicaria]KAI8082548.1 hypothetical protein B0P05DRAFT_578742 [Gilbertella persicaria]
MANTMGGAGMFLDPEIEAMALAFFCLASVILVTVLIWLVFVCLRVDDSIKWPWSIVFIPLWSLDGLLLWASIYRMKHGDPYEEQEEPRETDELLGSTKKKTTRYVKYQFISTCLLVLFQLLIVLQLDNVVQWPVTCVFLPFYAYQLMCWVLGKGTDIVLTVQITCVLLQLIFPGYSWAIVFIPCYMLGMYYGYVLWKQYKSFASMSDIQAQQQGKRVVLIASVVYVSVAALFYTVLGFIIYRLDGFVSIRLVYLFIPVFIILSILLCCTGCCLPCMLLASSLSQEETIIGSSRRIAE